MRWEVSGYVPMQGYIVVDVIDDFDQEAVAFPGDDSRPRELPVNGHDGLCLAEPCDILQLYLQRIWQQSYKWKLHV